MKILSKISYIYLSFVRRHTKFGLKIFEMKGLKHIRWNFHSSAWVMPKGWDFGGGGKGGLRDTQNFFFRNSTKFGV